ncbi:M14 family zinc carboxypeptidase [Spartinivicinus poritis]|uniref:M14 family zinc carboxypeptidase n=1 Tax=Spartinivicinus poritis TaxID=2994640 RepID=A0ABT5U2Q9_9GAMM|nr:M14 family zinc carboxypeptidase [Spartinivicinus sp. A2-2]MDE1460577.1 M14 family zinc carboxypeptidase [Spartinivicinus sp. A2-2]
MKLHSWGLVGIMLTGAVVGSAHTSHDLISQQKKTVKAFFPNLTKAHQAVMQFDTLESDYQTGYLTIAATSQEQQKLLRQGFKLLPYPSYQVALDNIRNRADNDSGIPGYSCYPTVEETFQQAVALQAKYPDLVQLVDIGDSWGKSNNKGGYDLLVLKLTNRTHDIESKPKLMISSAIHAREYATAGLTLTFAKQLLSEYGTEADATWVLDYHEVHILLQANPDGRKKAEQGVLWRKNVNLDAKCAWSSNRTGIDLNRNFSYAWNSTSNGSSGNVCNDTYRGTAAGSEPEVQALEAYLKGIFPDRRGPDRGDPAPEDTRGIHLDIHSHGKLILWPWGTAGSNAPNHQALQTLGRKFAYFNDHTPYRSVELYETDGTSDGASYGDLGVAAFTFELGKAFFESCDYFQKEILPTNLPALMYAAKVVSSPYKTPAGPDIIDLKQQTLGDEFSQTIELVATADDRRYSNKRGAEPAQSIQKVAYFIDEPPWLANTPSGWFEAVDGSLNQPVESVKAILDTAGWKKGQHTVYVSAQDADNNWGAVSALFTYKK